MTLKQIREGFLAWATGVHCFGSRVLDDWANGVGFTSRGKINKIRFKKIEKKPLNGIKREYELSLFGVLSMEHLFQ